MAKRSESADAILSTASPFPLTDSQWHAVVEVIGLSKREAQVAELILRDLGNKEIAAILGMSHKTVQTHLERGIGLKTSTRGRMQFSTYVLRLALRICAHEDRENT